jgi:hypothetical protein
MHFGEARTVDSVPPLSIPITTYSVGNSIRIDGKGRLGMIHDPQENNWFSQATTKIQGQIDFLVDSMKTQQIIIMSDGSVHGNRAGASWLITTSTAYDRGCYIHGIVLGGCWKLYHTYLSRLLGDTVISSLFK